MVQRSWLAAAAAAVAVLAVVAGGVALSLGGADDAGTTAADAADSSAAAGASGGGSPGEPGTAMPADPPSDVPSPRSEPSGVAPRVQPSISADSPLAVPVQSYEVLAPDRLQLRYTTGVPECSGRLHRAAVAESENRVVVTLLMRAGTAPASRPCPEVAVVRDVVVDLAAPLGERTVVDGVTRRPVPRGHHPA